jgi:hypothetical protein
VVRVANSSTDKVATRKIVRESDTLRHPAFTRDRAQLCFFLVDDEDQFLDEIAYHGFSYTGLADMHVLSSVDVPSQARACNLPTLRFLLPVACRQRAHGRRTLPPELVESIVAAALADGGLGITREEAEIRRRELMADRKVGSVGVSEVRALSCCPCRFPINLPPRFGSRSSRCVSTETGARWVESTSHDYYRWSGLYWHARWCGFIDCLSLCTLRRVVEPRALR